jgi:hypothetical protein
VNKHKLPDRTKVAPIQELLQRFHGARCISSIDLSSAFLKIELNPRCRKFTAIISENEVFQFKRVPYVLRNSLPAFVRGLNLALGADTAEFALSYVDDIVVQSTFSDYLHHFNVVFPRLTRSGFTINTTKCNFCRPEVTFLGHVISIRGVTPDPKRIEAILNYPRSRNVRNLKQVLGTCNYHHRFIVNYASYVAPLIPLLKKGQKWRWNDELQAAFETLRSKFAESIHLVHPDQSLPYAIYTDASKRAIGAVLMQTDKHGDTHIVSTALRVLSSVEQKYGVSEQELLAIVYALEKFRTYVYGQEITLYTDNRALVLLNRCALTSGRIARWVMEIQEYTLNIQHISGTKNFRADIIRRNPVGLSESEIKDLSKPRGIVITKIDLGIDTSVGRKLKDIATYQGRDTRLQDIIEAVRRSECQTNGRYLFRNGILYCRDSRSHPYWRPVVPAELQVDLIKYVHKSVGHLEAEKCMAHIGHSFYVKSLGRKARKVIATCDTCQRVKHPNRSYAVETRSHMPSEPELCALDIYGLLPVGRSGVRYILVLLDVFWKHTKLYALKSATTRTCLNKILGHYVTQIIKPRKILSDKATQFSSSIWKDRLEAQGIGVLHSPIRHPESNPSERRMRDLSKFFKINCAKNHKKWPELLPQIEEWINQSVSDATGYAPIELIFGEPKPGIFKKIITKQADQLLNNETVLVENKPC